MRKTIFLLLSAILLPAILPAQEDQEKIRKEVNLVRLDVLVTEKGGKPVKNLKKEDFIVSEDGARQDVLWLDSSNLPLSIVLVIDQSSSVNALLKIQKVVSLNFLSLLSKDDEMAIVGFDHSTHMICHMTSDHTLIEERLKNMKNTGGGTFLKGGLAEAVNILEKVPASRRKAVIFISDDQDDPLNPRDFDFRGTASNFITVFNILVGDAQVTPYGTKQDEPGVDFLRQITGMTGGTIINAQNRSAPKGELILVVEQLKHTYSLFYKPPGEKSGAIHKVGVDLKDNPRTILSFGISKKCKVFARKEYRY